MPRPQTHGFAGQRPPDRKSDRYPVYFYERGEPYFEFTNFSDHPVVYKQKRYPTSEHLYQAFKFLDTAHHSRADKIRRLPSARTARDQAGQWRQYQRPDWLDVNVQIMDIVLWEKFTQHPSLRQMLLDTDNRELIEDSPGDDFWGIGRNGTGRNELGKALMRIRERL
ncbi:DUF1768-domain-containing protein [Artomyces pyxidatus]|uniref:DUF1768-domain-containing protein n=1 Tax=Artomyces pyxidatus TaxID=48021 RepID=A0ACB8SUN0_9AGAM|nr:DUF1768-domain-containing protein [Artomyces pyxidatus]